MYVSNLCVRVVSGEVYADHFRQSSGTPGIRSQCHSRGANGVYLFCLAFNTVVSLLRLNRTRSQTNCCEYVQVYLIVDNEKVKLNLWDTAGQEDYDRLRPFSYRDADVLLILFDVNSRASYRNTFKRWIPEAKEHTKCPWILVGAKADCKDHKVTAQEAVDAAKEHGAAAYLEVSALKGTNMKELFELAVRVALPYQKSIGKHDTKKERHKYRFRHDEDSCRVACQGCVLQ